MSYLKFIIFNICLILLHITYSNGYVINKNYNFIERKHILKENYNINKDLSLNLLNSDNYNNILSPSIYEKIIQSNHIKSLLNAKSGIEAEGSGNPCKIKVIGVGGGGGNAVNRMMDGSGAGRIT